MLAQLPPHTVAKKVEDYEHLDILWGKDVDKVVIPHVLEFLKAFAEPVEGSKADEARSAIDAETLTLPAYSRTNPSGGRERREMDTAIRATGTSGLSYAQVIARDRTHISEMLRRERCGESESEDSECTVGEPHDGPHSQGAELNVSTPSEVDDSTVEEMGENEVNPMGVAIPSKDM
jgi:hypothetical protein